MFASLLKPIILASLIGLAAQAAEAQLCYTYRTFDKLKVRNKIDTTGQTTFESITHTGRIVGVFANQTPPDGFTLTRRLASEKVVVSEFQHSSKTISWPRKMNEKGEVVGLLQNKATGYLSGFMRHLNGKITRIDPPGTTYSQATGVNLQGDVVGEYLGEGGWIHGFLRTWGPDGKVIFTTIDGPGLEDTFLTGINDHQDIIGWYVSSADDWIPHGLHIVDGVQVTLDAPGAHVTYLLDINNAGAIVGIAMDDTNGHHGVLYQDGVWYSIAPGIGETLSQATGINDAGEIVGNIGIGSPTMMLGFTATPTTCDAAPALAMMDMQ